MKLVNLNLLWIVSHCHLVSILLIDWQQWFCRFCVYWAARTKFEKFNFRTIEETTNNASLTFIWFFESIQKIIHNYAREQTINKRNKNNNNEVFKISFQVGSRVKLDAASLWSMDEKHVDELNVGNVTKKST